LKPSHGLDALVGAGEPPRRWCELGTQPLAELEVGHVELSGAESPTPGAGRIDHQ